MALAARFAMPAVGKTGKELIDRPRAVVDCGQGYHQRRGAENAHRSRRAQHLLAAELNQAAVNLTTAPDPCLDGSLFSKERSRSK